MYLVSQHGLPIAPYDGTPRFSVNIKALRTIYHIYPKQLEDILEYYSTMIIDDMLGGTNDDTECLDYIFEALGNYDNIKPSFIGRMVSMDNIRCIATIMRKETYLKLDGNTLTIFHRKVDTLTDDQVARLNYYING